VSINKLIKKFLSKQKAISIEDVRQILEAFDYSERKKPGSECVFHKRGEYPICVPTVGGRHVKSQYVRLIVKRLNLEELYEKEKRD
jgi:hypothetical protein